MPRGIASYPITTTTPATPQRLRRPFRSIAWLALSAAFAVHASAAPVDRDTAMRAAAGWLARNPAPMGTSIGDAGRGATYSTASGDPLFHVLSLEPSGFVVVAADDEVEPVLAFSDSSSFRADTGFPLFDLLKHDTRSRIAALRSRHRVAAQPGSPRVSPIRARWNTLLASGEPDAAGRVRFLGVSDVSDLCVAPMVKSRWDQVSASIAPTSPGTRPTELYIYNYFTPPFESGNPYNYPAGCTPVAWAQIMRFHQWPKRIGAASHAIGIDGWGFWAAMRGGDGQGGPYDWENMPLVPGPATTFEQMKAIGALMLDAGIGIGADYNYFGTYATADASEMKHAFHYAEAKTCRPRPGLEELMNALRTSLDAGLPANLDIFTEEGIGHSLVVDGYGYNASTRFHHLNLGWGGQSDAWYNFPPIDVVFGDGSSEFFTIITSLKYNIDPLVAGEMITGRITDTDGRPVGGATVTVNTAPARTATTNSRGIYVFKGLASNVAYALSAAADGYLIESSRATATTGNAAVETETTPNRIVDFKAGAVNVAVSDPDGTRAGASVVLAVPANAAQPVAWLRNGAALPDSEHLSLTISSLQPADAGLYALTMTRGTETIESVLTMIGVETAAKIEGAGREVLSNIYVEKSQNTFDQVLLDGKAASVTADYSDRQITRISYIDLDDDIVQVEFSGPGTLTLTLDGATEPALPINYVQAVTYMKGHASIVITGATQDSHVSVFSVGKVTAANQALFNPDADYDGIADLAFIAIASRDGKFGGVRAANANFFAARGVTGIYAPGIDVTGPLFVGNVTAFDAAKPMILVGSASDVRITGGDLYQENGRAVQVSGLTHIAFRDGTDSHGNLIPAKANRATLHENGSDVTTAFVENAPPIANAP